MFSKLFKRKNNEVGCVRNSEIWFGELTVSTKDEGKHFIGWLDTEGLNLTEDQFKKIREYAKKVDKAVNEMRKEFREEIFNLTPDYTIKYSPISSGSIQFDATGKGPFLLEIKDSAMIPGNDSTYMSWYRFETKAEAEKEAKRLIKLAEENA